MYAGMNTRQEDMAGNRFHYVEKSMLRFLGVLFKMGLYNMANVRHYWKSNDWDMPQLGFGRYMGRNRFMRFWQLLELPDSEN